MGLIDKTIEIIISIFLIIIFATTILPAIAEATGQNLTWAIFLFIILIIAIIISFVKGILG